MPDRTSAILGSEEKREEVFAKLLSDVLYLKQGGCDALAVPCNTSHYFAERLAEESGMQLIHMPERTANYIASRCGENRKIAVLATDGTVKTGVYTKALEKAGLTPWYPDEAVQKQVMTVIYDRVKAGKPVTPGDWAAIEESIKNAGCSFVILGCTELSVARKELNLPDIYVDAMAVLADACVSEFSRA